MDIIWNEKLITRERAADLCGTWGLTIDYQSTKNCYLRCGTCSGNVTMLPSEGKIINIDGLIAAVVRHMAMNHGYKLSGVSNGDTTVDGTAAGFAGISSSGRIPNSVVH